MGLFIKTIAVGRNEPSLTLLHGWGLNGAVWDSVCESLSQYFMLHIVDLPGHGYSQNVPLSNLNDAADLLAEALQKKLKVNSTHVLGWSIGGQLALTLAQRYPALVNKLVLVATTPRFAANEEWQHGKKVQVLEDFAKRLANSYAVTIRGFLALQVLHQADARATVVALQRVMSLRGEPSANALQAGLTILRNHDVRDELPNILQPTLVIQGDRDALTAEPAARWMAGQLPNAHYALIAQAAHAPFLSHRELFLQHVVNHLTPIAV